MYEGKSTVPKLTGSLTGTTFVHTLSIPFWILEHPSSGLGVSDIAGNQQMPQKSLWIQPGFIIANRLRSQWAYHIAWQEKIRSMLLPLICLLCSAVHGEDNRKYIQRQILGSTRKIAKKFSRLNVLIFYEVKHLPFEHRMGGLQRPSRHIGKEKGC